MDQQEVRARGGIGGRAGAVAGRRLERSGQRNAVWSVRLEAFVMND
ncbi:hypothetical protein LGN09_00815 [Burkholderia cenocepacia]|nr:hypothetical protein [Burkholderia cenocepacia]MCA8403407.1 hypothetical protein [Burkholderia cenocepacia]